MSYPYPVTKTDDSLRDYVYKLKKKRRMKTIGTGCFANVYASKSGRTVIKVGTLAEEGDRCCANGRYLQYIALTQKHPNNPFFPRVKKVKIFENSVSDPYFMVEMERLKIVKKNSYPIAELFEYTMQDDRSIVAITAMFGKVNKHLVQAHKVMQKMIGEYGACVDIHNENIMKRGPQLVLTDPVT